MRRRLVSAMASGEHAAVPSGSIRLPAHPAMTHTPVKAARADGFRRFAVNWLVPGFTVLFMTFTFCFPEESILVRPHEDSVVRHSSELATSTSASAT